MPENFFNGSKIENYTKPELVQAFKEKYQGAEEIKQPENKTVGYILNFTVYAVLGAIIFTAVQFFGALIHE